ncbi:GFA family protein [Piscinibacter sp.]|uniref:GFA family protein n=1 Tax=Piscinibacter sp. TaxID=1903157 RepID=UPI0039E3C630
MTYQRYLGSCHCQGVRYEAEFDLAAGSNRCNCSLCSKARAWFLFVRGDKMNLLCGEELLSTYEWVPEGRSESGLSYRFCSRCGIRLYATGELAELGGRFYAIHVPTLDSLDRDELVNAPLRFVDNAHDRPDRAPTDTRLM